MTKKKQLEKLVKAEMYLKRTQDGYSPTGPWWKRGMPLLWEVRVDLGQSKNGQDLAQAHGILKDTDNGYDPKNPGARWKKAFKLIDGVQSDLHGPGIPNLGPIVLGDKSLLLWVPTHNTDGIFGHPNAHHDGKSYYPAFDSAFGGTGRKVIAPESLTIAGQSSADGADAFYATGVSGLKYWVGHVVSSPATGRKFLKGEVISTIARIAASDGGPHLHWGIDARPLIGRDFKWGRNGNGPDYTFGSPTIGQQLAAALAA